MTVADKRRFEIQEANACVRIRADMPGLFVAISAWVTAKTYRTVLLAVLVLGSLVGFGVWQKRVGLAGAVVAMMVWWLVLVVLWFE